MNSFSLTGMDDFEWELSKENVKPLPGGRSVELLNKVLSTQHTREFQQRRQHIRQHFELKISHLPASFVKLRLYARYMRWVEQNYPCLGRSADLETLLYRCVRDVGQLAGVQNDQDFVDVWIRLTEYCAQPVELFELLFRQGVGTMCTKFYVAWASVLESLGNFQRTAAVYAHGLRARAKPLFWLEDRSELFLSRYSAHLARCADQDQLFATGNMRADAPGNSTEPVRQTLAALRLVESRAADENARERQLKAPVIRSREMWHPSQSGLGQSGLTNLAGNSDGALQPCPRVRVGASTQRAEPVDGRLLHTLAPLSQPDTEGVAPADLLRPLGQPSHWQKENCPKPTSWRHEQIDVAKLMPTRPRAASPSWEIYSEQPPSTDTVPCGSIPTPNTGPIGKKKNAPRKGLALLNSTDASGSTAPRLTVPIFELLFQDSTTTTDLAAHETSNPSASPVSSTQDSASHADRIEMLQQLILPSLPVGQLPPDAEFGIPLRWIYGGAEEMCWEMHHAAQWERSVRRMNVQAVVNAWLAEEEKLIKELEQLELDADETPRLPDDGPVEFSSARLTLIKSLEAIALSDESSPLPMQSSTR